MTEDDKRLSIVDIVAFSTFKFPLWVDSEKALLRQIPAPHSFSPLLSG
jgi:hypothetical protein